MPTVITGTEGINQVQAGAVESGDLPAGSVIQVVSATNSTETSTTSLSFVSTGLEATITPTQSSSKILIVCHTGAAIFGLNSTAFTIYRGGVGGTNLGDQAEGMAKFYADTTGSERIWSPVSLNYLDSSNTTSATTYTMAMRANSNVTLYSQYDGTKASMTLMEIAG